MKPLSVDGLFAYAEKHPPVMAAIMIVTVLAAALVGLALLAFLVGTFWN